MLLQGNKPLFAVLLLLAVSVANASPTATTDNTIMPTVQQVPDTPTVAAPNNEAIEPIDSKLADIGRLLLTPPALSTSSSFSASTSGQFPHAKSLPAVPAAILMVLTGFLCVSLVRDRRVWLAALASLLWVGQAGIQALPQLALRLSHKNHSQQQLYAGLTYPYYLENSSRLRSDIEGTRYMGLLHHLAGIPDSTMSFSRTMSFLQPRLSFLHKQESRNTSHEPRSTNRAPQFAIIRQLSCLIPATNCPASRAEQFICFSPAFIFAQLPRGPPLVA